MSEIAGRDALLGQPAARRFATEKVDGFGEFRLRSLTAGEANAHENARYKANGQIDRRMLDNADCRLIAISAVDEQGNLLFTVDDVPELMKLPAAVINQLTLACLRLNQQTSVEDAEKN